MSDPFNSRYNPKESGREHSCFGKIKAIMERTGVLLTHDEITYICEYLWHCSSPEEFYHKMDSMSDGELKEVVQKAKYMKKPKLTVYESMLYA
ncbi:MAG TPA: hypothetical protein VED17_07200 [Nitrososphaerales archaeon]|nr:hypothetical protein [Nitrososphaerales archaeon]